jgi:hypothetical protein
MLPIISWQSFFVIYASIMSVEFGNLTNSMHSNYGTTPLNPFLFAWIRHKTNFYPERIMAEMTPINFNYGFYTPEAVNFATLASYLQFQV